LETLHKVLNSGCQAEQSKLRTAERLTHLLAVLCIVGWRVFWLTMVDRTSPEAPAETVWTKTEIEFLDRMVENESTGPTPKLGHYLTVIAKLGGTWHVQTIRLQETWCFLCGLSIPTDTQIGFELRERDVGN
jgi:hypothetical protein